MLGRVAQPPERLQVAGGRAPPAAPVGGQPGQLTHGGHAGGLVGHGLDRPQRILEAPTLVGAVGRLGPVDQVLPVAGGRDVGGVADFGGDLRRQGVPRATARRWPRVALPAAAAAGVRAGPAPLASRPRRARRSVSSHSRAPSSRVHGAAGLRPRRAPRRRSRSSSASPPRSSAARRADLVGAPAGDVAPPRGLAGQRRPRPRGSAARLPAAARRHRAGRRRGVGRCRSGRVRALLLGWAPVRGAPDRGRSRGAARSGRRLRLPDCPGRPAVPCARSPVRPPAAHRSHLPAAARPARVPPLLVVPAGSAASAVPLPRLRHWPRRSASRTCSAARRRGRPARPALRPLPAADRPRRAAPDAGPTRPRRRGAAIRLGGVLGHRVILRVRSQALGRRRAGTSVSR